MGELTGVLHLVLILALMVAVGLFTAFLVAYWFARRRWRELTAVD